MSICKRTVLLIILLTLSMIPVLSEPASVKKEVYTIQLTDINMNDTWLPFIGEYPVMIIYEDFRNYRDNRKLYSEIINEPGLKEKIKLIYISNMAPAWYSSDNLISIFFRNEENKFPEIIVLLDSSRGLQTKWRLPDSDGKSLIILVNRKAEIEEIFFELPGKNGRKKLIAKLKEMAER